MGKPDVFQMMISHNDIRYQNPFRRLLDGKKCPTLYWKDGCWTFSVCLTHAF